MRRMIGIMGALALAGGVASANANNPQELSKQDQQFVNQAYSINAGEVKLGELAQKKGTTPDVKDYGRRLAEDHRLGLEQLQRAAQKDNIRLPTQLDQKHQELYQKLSQLSGPQFDQAYLEHMKEGHQEAIDTFQKEVDKGSHQNLKQYAQKQLPVLKAHKAIAKQNLKEEHEHEAAPTGTMPGTESPEQMQQQPLQPEPQPIRPEQQPTQPEQHQPY